jgi:hypothetical protein
MNRLRMEHRASLSAADREIERIEVRRKKLVESIMDGVPASELKDELNANVARREELKARLASAVAPPPLLHPEMAELYWRKVKALAQALEHSETRTEASEALRGLIDAIVLTPRRGRVANRIEGEFGGDVGGRPKCEEVARNGRPHATSCDGCGGPQPSGFGVRLGCSVVDFRAKLPISLSTSRWGRGARTVFVLMARNAVCAGRSRAARSKDYAKSWYAAFTMTAATGAEGPRRAREMHPNIILLD